MIDILLPTFNGAAFLDEQLDSIFRQSNPDFRLLVRDDGSTDGTRKVLAKWAAVRPNVVCIDPEGPHMGPSASISRLLERSQAPHVMLSDQDDVWLPEKIAVLLGRMRRLEEALGGPTPILVHSDLIVVDSSLRTLHPSFWTYRRLDPVHGATLRRLAVENVVAGCSAIINRALVEECLPIPQQAIMHDWWIALVAAARGRIESVAEPLTLYRQHAVNAVGVRRPGLAAILGRTGAFFTDAGFHGHLGRTLRQAQALLDRFDARLSEADRAALSAYATLADCGCLRRRWRLLRHGFRTSSCLGNVKLFFGV